MGTTVLGSLKSHMVKESCLFFPLETLPCSLIIGSISPGMYVKEIDLWRSIIRRGHFQRNYFKAVLLVHHILTSGIFSITHRQG